jgi:hypothetical protein
METNKEYLVQLAYSFFPRGKEDRNESEYMETDEFTRLLEKLGQKNEFNQKLKCINDELCKKRPSVYIEDLSSIGPYDRCIKQYIYFEDKITLVLYISVLIPYFVLYEYRNLHSADNLDTEVGISSQDESNKKRIIVKEVKTLLAEYFTMYSKMSLDLMLTHVPNIVFNGNGKLSSWPVNNDIKPMNIFNVYFSDNFY